MPPEKPEKRSQPYEVHLTRRSQSTLESLSTVERTRVLSAIQGLSRRRAVAGAARFSGQTRDGAVLFEVALGNLKLVFKVSEFRTITIVEIQCEKPRKKR